MGRKKLSDEAIEDSYARMHRALKNKGGSIYRKQMKEITGLTDGRMSRVLKEIRRGFNSDNMKIQDYIMASNSGYFLPTRGREVVAYTAQVYMDAISRIRTIMPIYQYTITHYEDELKNAILAHEGDFDDGYEVNPWENFNRVMDTYHELYNGFELYDEL